MFFKESKYRCSVSQTADRNYFYAVRPRVCKLAAGNDHQQIRFPKICFAGSICSTHKLLDLKQVLCAFFNFAAAELELDQRISAIRQVEHTVRLQIGTVVIVAVSFFLPSVYHVSRRYREAVLETFPHERRLFQRLNLLIKHYPGSLWSNEQHERRMQYQCAVQGYCHME